MKKLSVIIVNYNTKEILRDCVLNLENKYPNMQLIVVDNASSDGSAEMIKSEFIDNGYDWIRLINSENNGLSAAYNLGLDASDGEYVLFLGSDAFPKTGVLEGLVNYLESDKNIGAVTAKLVLRDGSLDMDAHRGFPTPWAAITHFTFLDRIFPKSKLFNQYFLGFKDFSIPHEIDLCISHFLLMPKVVFTKIGKWDEDYFLYGEDVDMCWRIKQAGYKIMYNPNYEAVHYKGATIGIRKTSSDIEKATPEMKLKMQKTSVESMKIFYKKHFEKKYPKIVTISVLFAVNSLLKIRVLKQRLFS